MRNPGTPPTEPQARRLRVLHLEDSEPDHELALAHLRRAGLDCDAQRVETEAAFREALGHPWDVILSDFNLPGFSGLRALEIVREQGLQTPFILVSGEIGEDVAVQAMRDGASDYLLKANLKRLAPATEHAIAAHESRRARQRADEDLAASRERLSELAQHLQTSIELERTAIAREIHDDVGGSLSALKFDLAWIARQANTSPEAKARLDVAMDSLNHALEASQRIMHNLRPAILDHGLVPALQWMAQRFERRTGVVCAFRASHDNPELPTGLPLVAYRTAQEALTNISKHAQASRVAIDFSLAQGVLSLEISDNGCGLAEQDLAKARSFGIRGLHERASTVGGWVELTSNASGTTLILSIPLQADGAVRADEAADESHDPSAWGDL
jgi:signal transduction histidine kinase